MIYSGESLAYTLQFSSEQRKKAWIEEFEEAKKKQRKYHLCSVG